MADDKVSVQLSEYLFNVCEAVGTPIQGKNADDLDEPVRKALEDLERCVHWCRHRLFHYQVTAGFCA